MKRLSIIAGAVFLCAAASFGIGLQHGVFRSQSTQGADWQGTAVIESERFDITVFPDYLDVDLEWVFRVGGAPPDSFKNALEIVGNLNLDAHSTVVGLITWYKGKILKGKLKADSIAKQQYEDVVQRSSDAPPPPRDPVLFEYGWGEDNYYISIFPAAFDSTRKVRIRYLIPAFNIDGVNKIAYPYSFTANPVVTVKTGEGVSGYVVEAQRSKRLFENPLPVALDAGTDALHHRVHLLCRQRLAVPPRQRLVQDVLVDALQGIRDVGLPDDFVHRPRASRGDRRFGDVLRFPVRIIPIAVRRRNVPCRPHVRAAGPGQVAGQGRLRRSLALEPSGHPREIRPPDRRAVFTA